MYNCIISLIFKITPLICLDSKTVSMITPISKPSSQENIGKKMLTVSFGEFPGCSLARRGSAGPVNTAVCCSTQCHMMPRKPILSSVIPLLFLRPSGLYALQCILSWHFSLEILISYFTGQKDSLRTLIRLPLLLCWKSSAVKETGVLPGPQLHRVRDGGAGVPDRISEHFKQTEKALP